jgi:hypothetical protein
MANLRLLAMVSAWLPEQDARPRRQTEMRICSQVDRAGLSGRSIRRGYRTDCATAFLTRRVPASDEPSARLAGVYVNREESPMITRTKTLIAAAAFAALATSAFAQVPWEFNPGMAYMYSGPGKMSAMAMAASPKNHDTMMKKATKVPANTMFFMDNGQLYSVSGTLDPTGNFYRP